MKRFLNLADFSREQILDLLALAQALQDKPEPQALAGKILGLVFFNPSLRTLASFQAGMARLGGSSFVITPGQGTWQLETRLNAIMKGAAAEHIREGIPVLASYCDALGVRAFAEGKDLEQDLGESLFGMIDELCDKPLINMESAMNHPCQALADWRTMDELKVPQRAKFVLSWVYHPKALPLAVPAATVHMAAMRGMEVVVLRPEGFALPPQIMLAFNHELDVTQIDALSAHIEKLSPGAPQSATEFIPARIVVSSANLEALMIWPSRTLDAGRYRVVIGSGSTLLFMDTAGQSITGTPNEPGGSLITTFDVEAPQ